MTSKQRLLAILASLAASSAMLMGCGGGADCGEGTREVDGECVMATPVATCGEGTLLINGECILDSSDCPVGTVFDDAAGACVISSDACGDGTTFDSGLNRCLPDSIIVCGEGTQLQDGNCVAIGTDPDCATGTTLQDGRCIVSPTVCSAGTTLDPTTNTCVLNDEACATGLELADGSCVATDEICGDGTHFSPDTGLCLPEATCREGDVILEGLCVPPAEALAADPNAIDLDAEDVISLGELPDVGERVVFKGAISDLTDDGHPLTDLDSFTFEGTSGQWVKLSVQSIGAPNLGFFVFGPEGEDYTYERWSTVGIDTNPARTLVLPNDGEYTVVVAPSAWMQDLFYHDGFFYNGGYFDFVGSDDFEYVGTLEEIDAPTPTEIILDSEFGQSPSLEGTSALLLTENYFEISGVQLNEIASFNLAALGRNVVGLAMIWDADGNFIEEVTLGSEPRHAYLMGPEGLRIVIDAWTALSPGIGYELTSRRAVPTDLPEGSLTGYEAGDTLEYEFDQNFEQVDEVWFRIRLEEPLLLTGLATTLGDDELADVDVYVYDDNLDLVFFSAEDGPEYFEDERLEAGAYYILIDAWETAPAGFDLLIEFEEAPLQVTASGNNTSFATAEAIPDFDHLVVGDVTSGLNAPKHHWSFTLPGTEPAALIFAATKDAGAGYMTFWIYDSNQTLITESLEVRTNGNTTFEAAVFQPNETYYVVVGGVEVNWDDPITYSLTIEDLELDSLEVEPNNDMTSANDLGNLSDLGELSIAGTVIGTESDYFEFYIDADSNVGISFEDLLGDLTTVDYELLDDTGTAVTVEMNVASLTAGTYYVHVTQDVAMDWGNAYVLTLEEADEPAPTVNASGTNTSFATADTIPDFDHVLLGSATDGENSSFWTFTVTGTEDITLEIDVTKLSGFGWATFWIYDAAETELAQSSQISSNGGSTTLTHTFTAGETYYIVFGGQWPEDNDPYDYSVSFEVL